MLDFVNEVNGRSKPKLERYLQSRDVVFWPSHANYLFCYFDQPTSLEAALRSKNILVRPKKDENGTLGLRMTIGTEEQTDGLISALDELLPKRNGSEPEAKKPRL